MKKQNGKLFLFIGGLLAIIIMILNLVQLFFVTNSTKKQVQRQTTSDYKELTKSYSNLIKAEIDKYFVGLDFYTNAQILKETDNEEDIIDWLHINEPNRDSLYSYVAFVDSEANFYSDTGNVTNIKERDYFQSIMINGAEQYIDNPVTGKTTGKTVVHICRKVSSGSKVKGFFCGVVDITKITPIIDDIDTGDRGYAVMFGSNGEIITANTEIIALKAEIESLKNGDVGSYSKIQSTFGATEPITESFYNTKDQKQILFSAPIKNTPWTLALIFNEATIDAPAKTVAWNLGISSITITLAIILISTFIIFKSIKPIGIVEKTIRGIATGDADLTKRIHVNTNNEIGRVVEGFNLFAEKLQTIVATMKDSKEQLVNVGQLLQDSTSDTTNSIAEIITNISTMSEQVTSQTDSVHQTAGAVNQIASNIESLNRMIESQVSSVTQASAAVEEMIGNINSVNTSVQKMGKSFEELEQKAIIGVQRQNDVNSMIDEIEKQSQMLQEANTVISGIAEQTNLLAMNAAIEAAHAGEAGKGFSVVADEIRKLSEDSSSQSQTIGVQLSKIMHSIEAIVGASQVATDAFSEVSAGINSTTNLVREITNAMLEQNEGSKQIVQALNSMNDTSEEVKTASFEMSEGNKAILEEIKNLQDATFSIKDGMDVMSNGARKINETGAALSTLSEQIQSSIETIGIQVDQFKVK